MSHKVTKTNKHGNNLRVSFILTILFAMLFCVNAVLADPPYTVDATLNHSDTHPGVYYAEARKGDTIANKSTIGISSIAKQTLENGPTTQSPAIIIGAAVPYEKRLGPAQYEPIPGAALYPPYSYFRYTIINEAGADGTYHKKMSGFDGSYVIIRVDVSKLIEGAPENSYLHVKQSGNKALMVALGETRNGNISATFSDAGGNKVGVYSLNNNAAAMKDTSGNDTDKPYLDIILLSSGTLVQGADTGSTDPAQVVTADFSLSFYVDQTIDYNPDLVYDPNWQPPADDPNAKTMAQQMIEKYYDESKVNSDAITSYTVKGSDLELEVMNDEGERAGKPEFWSLRKALTYTKYDGTPIKMICEVPVLEGLVVDDAGKEGRHVIFDVNSFDIQIANHQNTGAAALTVSKAKLTVKDGSNTTGAELAVGNNARMEIKDGGTLVIDESCQLEVEYDAASTTPQQEGTEPAPAQELNNGLLVIEPGGEVINNGVITIEGTEGKPVDPAAPAIRDKKDAILNIMQGGKLTNNGCLLSYGKLYNLGTIENNGRYEDLITSNDPDKGKYTYHKGIQISWKDDVTQDDVYVGRFFTGIGSDEETINKDALLINNGDIVLVPGLLANYGVVNNTDKGNIYLSPVEEAVIPVLPSVDQPLVTEKRVRFYTPVKSYFENMQGSSLTNAGNIAAADVEIVSNGRFGALTPLDTASPLISDLRLYNYGTVSNSGAITLDSVDTYGETTNTGTIQNKVLVSASNNDIQGKQTGKLIDQAPQKLTNVFNAALTTDGNTNIWTYAPYTKLIVDPAWQSGVGGDTVSWTVTAETESADEIRYKVNIEKDNSGEVAQEFYVTANQETKVTGPVLPLTNGNVVYCFYIDDGMQVERATTNAAVQVTYDDIIPPSVITGLVYNGKAQTLVTAGSVKGGTVEYRLGMEGAWSANLPTGKNAGEYPVYYRKSGTSDETGPLAAAIAPKPVTVSADNVTGLVNTDLKPLNYTVSGLVTGEALNGIQISAAPNLSQPGNYPVTVSVTGNNPNYTVTTNNGTYTVTNNESLSGITVKDTYGVYGTAGADGTAYKGYNITIEPATLPSGTTIYYSVTGELTKDNYNTAGLTAMNNLPAGAGEHKVWYYITNGSDAVSGCNRVIIDKADQEAPAGLKGLPETYLNSADGTIQGAVRREMEYRPKDGTADYKIVGEEFVDSPSGNLQAKAAETSNTVDISPLAAGTYLVRKADWDGNRNPSPDTEVVVGEGPKIKVNLNTNGGTPAEINAEFTYGDLIKPDPMPTNGELTLAGWIDSKGNFLDLNSTVLTTDILPADGSPMNLTAKWIDGTDEINVTGSKVLQGRALTADDIWTYTITADDGGPLPENTVVQNEMGTFTFGSIPFSLEHLGKNGAAKPYTYTVTESGSIPGVTNDSEDSKSFTVTVSQDADGNLHAVSDPESLTFNNVYEAKGAIQIKAVKTLKGDTLEEGGFSFALMLPDGSTVRVSNGADGSVVFPPIAYTLKDAGKTYTYTVSEIIPDKMYEDTKYDSSKHVVVVNTTDNGKGVIEVAATIDGKDAEIKDGVVNAGEFLNIYTGDLVVELSGTMRITNYPGGAQPRVTILLYEDNEEIARTSTARSGAYGFTRVYEEPGTHVYTIKQLTGKIPGMTYDTREYTVTVTVTADEYGILSAEFTGDDPTSLDFENTYDREHPSTHFDPMPLSLPRTGFSARHASVLPEMPMNLNYKPLGLTLQIPSLSLSTEIVQVPEIDGEYPISWLGAKAGLLEGFGKPGNGRTVLTGHNHLNDTDAGPFALLMWMEAGDRIFVTGSNGEMQAYAVYANEKIDAYDFDSLEQISAEYDNSIALITCEDETDAGNYANRRVVFARPM